MPLIKINKTQLSFEVSSGTNLMTALLSQEIPVASSCHGKGICSKCRIQIVSGSENLNLESDRSQSLREKNNIAKNYRISCQTEVHGDIIIDANYW